MSKAQFEDMKALNHTNPFTITFMTQNRATQAPLQKNS